MDGATIFFCFVVVFFSLLALVYIRTKIRTCEQQAGTRIVNDDRNSRRRPSNHIPLTNQDDDIYNISSRVNQQGSGTNWPTHDHHLDVDFVLAPEYTAKDTRPPPPPYAEVDLPSYEQATGCRAPQPDLPAVHIASDRNVAGPSR